MKVTHKYILLNLKVIPLYTWYDWSHTHAWISSSSLVDHLIWQIRHRYGVAVILFFEGSLKSFCSDDVDDNNDDEGEEEEATADEGDEADNVTDVTVGDNNESEDDDIDNDNDDDDDDDDGGGGGDGDMVMMTNKLYSWQMEELEIWGNWKDVERSFRMKFPSTVMEMVMATVTLETVTVTVTIETRLKRRMVCTNAHHAHFWMTLKKASDWKVTLRRGFVATILVQVQCCNYVKKNVSKVEMQRYRRPLFHF